MHISPETLHLIGVGKGKYELKMDCYNEDYAIVRIMKEIKLASPLLQTGSNEVDVSPFKKLKAELENEFVLGEKTTDRSSNVFINHECTVLEDDSKNILAKGNSDENNLDSFTRNQKLYGMSLENSPCPSKEQVNIRLHSYSEHYLSSDFVFENALVLKDEEILPSHLLSQAFEPTNNEKNHSLLEEDCQPSKEWNAMLKINSDVEGSNMTDEMYSFENLHFENSFPELSQSTLLELDNAMSFYKSKDCSQQSDELRNANFNEISIDNQPSFGFMTAAGKSVKISEKSLSNAKSMFNMYDDSSTNLPTQNNSQFETDDVADEIKKDFDFLNQPSALFSTAAGKKVTIKKESVLKAAAVFRDAEIMNEQALLTDSDKHISANSNFYSQNKINNALPNPSIHSLGFSTAAGRGLKISKENLTRAAFLLEDKENIENVSIEKPLSTQPFLGNSKFLNIKKRATETKTSIGQSSRLGNPQFIPPKSKILISTRPPVANAPKLPRIVFDLSKVHSQLPTLKQFIRINNSLLNNVCSSTSEHSQSVAFQFDQSTVLSRVSSTIPGIEMQWFNNHYSLLYWKYNSFQIKYPTLFKFSNSDLVDELLYRFQVEFLEGKRSLIRMIAEKDDSAAHNMILIVYDIIYDDPLILILTDGWYLIRAKVDEPLALLTMQKKIYVGLKLNIYGAQLESSTTDGMPVLDAFDKISLKLSANSVRPATPFKRLGICKLATFAVSLNCVFADGGLIPCIDVIVQRKYPVSYIKSGITITENEYYKEIERIQNDVYSLPIPHTTLTNSQPYPAEPVDNSCYYEEKFREEVKKITCLFKFKVTNYSTASSPAAQTEAIFSYWRPSDDVLDVVREGSRVRIFNCKATSNYKGTLSLANTAQTVIERKKAEPSILTNCYVKRRVLTNFLDTATGQECDFECSVESISECTSSQQFLVLTVRDTNNNCGLLRVAKSFKIPTFTFPSSNSVVVRNACVNFYDKERNVFIFSLSEHSTMEMNQRYL